MATVLIIDCEKIGDVEINNMISTIKIKKENKFKVLLTKFRNYNLTDVSFFNCLHDLCHGDTVFFHPVR